MQYQATSPEDYIAQLPEERRPPMQQLRQVILENIPQGFEETINYGMIGYVVPHSLYPPGYHCTPKLPLPFMNIASQKKFIAVYHAGIYAIPELMEWFVDEYPKYCTARLDMGKSCIRFKKIDHIPYDLIGQLAGKMTPAEWIEVYERVIKKK